LSLIQKVEILEKFMNFAKWIFILLIVNIAVTIYTNQHSNPSSLLVSPQSSINSSSISSFQRDPISSTSPRNPYHFCDYVFIDCGTNRGDNIKAFAGDIINEEITDFKNSIFKTYNVTEGDFCVFGFEGNTIHTKKLIKRQEKYNEKFRLLKIFYETLISDTDGKLKFYTDNGYKHEGSSISVDKTSLGINADRFETVNSIDFTNFLHSFREAKVIFIKLDVEGAEFGILSESLAKGSFCVQGTKFYIAIEYHIGKKASSPPYREIENSFGDVVETILHESCDVEWFHIRE